jgi:hypothetical protein
LPKRQQEKALADSGPLPHNVEGLEAGGANFQSVKLKCCMMARWFMFGPLPELPIVISWPRPSRPADEYLPRLQPSWERCDHDTNNAKFDRLAFFLEIDSVEFTQTGA